jgi:hypothetical protein
MCIDEATRKCVSPIPDNYCVDPATNLCKNIISEPDFCVSENTNKECKPISNNLCRDDTTLSCTDIVLSNICRNNLDVNKCLDITTNSLKCREDITN